MSAWKTSTENFLALTVNNKRRHYHQHIFLTSTNCFMQTIQQQQYFKAMPIEAAFQYFEKVNQNPANGYRSGYEEWMSLIPKIEGPNDGAKQSKLILTAAIITDLAYRLKNQNWVWNNWPAQGQMLTRTILAIDEITKAQLILVRWNAIETPIHGHQAGQMIDFLIEGTAKEIEYELVDRQNRLVIPRSSAGRTFTEMSVLSNEYNTSEEVNLGALIHKFIPLTRAITLHLIPEMPRDGKGNLFTETNDEGYY
jgi:hypothetical protein